MTSTPEGIIVRKGAPRSPAGHSPLRRSESLRRTSSLDMTWPEGREGLTAFEGHCRDVVTMAAGDDPLLLCQDRLHARLSWDRVIQSIASDPSRPWVAALVGARGGGHLRAALAEVMGNDRAHGSPLNLLIDDLSGASLIAGWAWSRWSNDWLQRPSHTGPPLQRSPPRNMENICSGFRTGSSALAQDGSAARGQNTCRVTPLAHPDDPLGWHPLTEHSGVSMRRARRIDLWRHDDGRVHIDAGFQDSASAPEGGRVAIHEYSLYVTTNSDATCIETVSAEPHVLPYAECPAAASNVSRLVGAPLAELRTLVIETLPGTLGCTHLNDALRALADVPELVAVLQARITSHGN